MFHSHHCNPGVAEKKSVAPSIESMCLLLLSSLSFTCHFALQAGHDCNAQGLQGSWECFDGFQGTMRAPTWAPWHNAGHGVETARFRTQF